MIAAARIDADFPGTEVSFVAPGGPARRLKRSARARRVIVMSFLDSDRAETVARMRAERFRGARSRARRAPLRSPPAAAR